MQPSFAFDRSETAVVVGLGKSGLASAEVLRARGVCVYVTDEGSPAALADALAASRQCGASFIAPGDVPTIAPSLQYVVLSPGVPLTSPVMHMLQIANIPVLSEIEVAYQLCAAPIIAVTGTKGKSTTAALIAHLLRVAGRGVRLGGNIGDPLINEAVAARADEWVVAEVSSFQLETTRDFKPRVAVLLNIAPDHLDRYASMDAYARAKYRVVANQTGDDTFVGDFDDERVASLRNATSKNRLQARAMWFTLGSHRDGVAMYLDGDAIVYVSGENNAEHCVIVQRGDIPLAGAHNVRNVMAAMLAALAIGVDPANLLAGVRSFRAMPHRLERVDELDGVLYVDDSKSTNPSSVVAALRAYDRPIVLIAGGRSKGTSFSEMGAMIRERAKALIAIGESADEIASYVTGVPIVHAASMHEAVQRACAVAEAGDVVLLSPGCSSFDMFRSAEDRGEQFVRAVATLREAANA